MEINTNSNKHHEENARVRFAPSPTGNLHIGGVRTALFNYLFALQNKGKFILRIDDTDIARSKKEYEKSIVKDLEWFDIKWDEFYRQSERKSIYENYLGILIEKGLIYECFCTEEEILISKELAIKSGKPYIYTQRCLKMDSKEKDELRDKFQERGLYPSLRFNVSKIGLPAVEFDDMVHGRLSFNSRLLGDFIVKTEKDRFTYNFASIIDDAELGITHIIRGEDHISNTPKQILILKTIGKSIPKFAHISLLFGKDGKIMSKRDSASNIHYYKTAGYLPGAILNYLAITGNTIKKEIFSNINEIASLFDITKTKSSGAIFDEEKLRFINEKWLTSTPPAELFKIISEKYENFENIGGSENIKGILNKLEETYGKEKVLAIIDFLKNEFKTVKDLTLELKIFLDDFDLSYDNFANDFKESRNALGKEIDKSTEFNEASLKKIIKDTSLRADKPVKDYYETLRFFLTGKLDGPSIIRIAALMGKERVVSRLTKIGV